MSKILNDLSEYWYKILSTNTLNYPCILKSIELSEDDLAVMGYPHIRYEILEVNELSEGVLYTRSLENDKINERFNFSSRYLLDFDLYFKSDESCDIDDLKMKISNHLLMSRISQNYDYTNKGFSNLVLRDSLQERPVLDIFQDQTINRNNYQQPFVIDIVRNNEVYRAKEGNLIYKGRV